LGLQALKFVYFYGVSPSDYFDSQMHVQWQPEESDLGLTE